MYVPCLTHNISGHMLFCNGKTYKHVFIYLGFYITFNTVQVISRQVVGRAEETSTYSWSRFCTVNCQPTASNYQLSQLRPCGELNPGLRGGRQECYHTATVAPYKHVKHPKTTSGGCFIYLYLIFSHFKF